mmetsp:Transcript_2819/g.5861  ORF Transcript_2819/g.5861 Transcript_2819/m.5861 type:complete len:605 (-) Transcript_2819:271-2085(-)
MFYRDHNFSVGRQLLAGISPTDIDSIVFTVVDQLNRGSSLITEHDEKLMVARLNLKAGEKAIGKASFLQASLYLVQGTAMICQEDWKDQYDLCLRLYTALAESQLAHADYDSAIQSINPVLANGINIQDKLRAYYACVVAFISQAKMGDALQLALSVLEQLGETFPANSGEADVKSAFEATTLMMLSTSEAEILAMSNTADETKVAAMRFALIANKCAFAIAPRLHALIAFRMVQMTLQSGLTPESSYAFTQLAILCGGFISSRGHHIERSCGRTALALVEKFDHKYSHVVYAMLYHSVFPYTQPIQACLEQIKLSYLLGMRVGDCDWALSILPRVSQVGLFSGRTLVDLESEMRLNVQELKTYKHYMIQVNLLVFQTVLNLRSSSESISHDPTILTGEAMDELELLAAFADNQMRNSLRIYYYCRMFLTYLFRRYDIAAGIVEKQLSLMKELHFLTKLDVVYEMYETFYRGLIGLAILRKGGDEGREKWNDIVSDSTNKMKEWAQQGSKWNFENKLALLLAEHAAVIGDLDGAQEAYINSIQKAEEHNFINEQALACERFGLFYLEIGNDTEGRHFLGKAEALYRKWGSLRKGDDILTLLKQK